MKDIIDHAPSNLAPFGLEEPLRKIIYQKFLKDLSLETIKRAFRKDLTKTKRNFVEVITKWFSCGLEIILRAVQ